MVLAGVTEAAEIAIFLLQSFLQLV